MAPSARMTIKLTVPLNDLTPFDVVSPIEAGEHHARGCALARELVRHVASHHRKPSSPEPGRRMIGHLDHHDAANDDQLLLGGVGMPRHHASGGAFRIHVDGPVKGSPVSSADARHATSRSGANGTDPKGFTVPVIASSAPPPPPVRHPSAAAARNILFIVVL